MLTGGRMSPAAAAIIGGLFVLVLPPAAPAASAGAGAQDAAAPRTVTRWRLATVKTGHDLQWEAAFREHVDWRRSRDDTWTWHTYVLASGDRLGQYLTLSADHAWADFDAPDVPEREDAADLSSRLGPHLEALRSGFWHELVDFSRPPDDPPPFPLIQIVDYRIKPGRRAVFERNVEQFGEALDKTGFAAAYLWFVKPHGGAAARTFTRIVPRADWASMMPAPGAQSAPGVRTSYDAMRATFGEAGLQAWIASFGESVEWLTSTLWRHRPDLSYVP